MPEDNPYEELAKLWQEAKDKFGPLRRFISARYVPSSPVPQRTKFSEFSHNPWTWGGVGMVAVLLQFGPLWLPSVFAFIFFSVAVFQVKPLERFEILAIPARLIVCALIGVGLWFEWRLVPKPQKPLTSAEIENITKKNLPTAADIAAEVKKILPIANAVGISSSSGSIRHTPIPEVSLIFKDSPLFTPERKLQITDDINGFYLYLKGIGFPVEKEVPPLGVSRSNVQMMAGTFPGPVYYRQILFPNDSLDDPDKIREVYASYVFRLLFHTVGYPLSPDATNDMTTATLFNVYFPSSLVSRNLDRAKWQGHDWMQALWEIRSKKGKDFTDRAMYYTYKLWDPAPAGEFNKKFLTRFMAGVWVIDNNGESIAVVGSILANHHLTQE